MERDKFSNVLNKLAERIEEKVIEKSDKKHILLNRIDLEGFRKVIQEYVNDRSLCKKTLSVDGRWRLDVAYGPQFEARLKTERAGEIMVHTDETTLFGGSGTAIHPIQLCMAGFCGCFSAAFAKWTAMEGIKLNQLNIRTRADLDISSTLGIQKDIPIVDDYEIELMVDSESNLETLMNSLELTKLRCFCSYCISNKIIPNFTLRKMTGEQAAVDNKSNNTHTNKNQINGSESYLNRVNLKAYKDTIEMYTENPSLCKQVLEVEGRWRLDVEYGPQFEIKLQTEQAGEITVQTDETIILGGGGTSFHPVALCITGFSASVLNEFANLASLKGIHLRELESQAKMDIDLTSSFGIEDGIEMIDTFDVEILVDAEAPFDELNQILNNAIERSFCVYCYMTPIFPNVYITTEKAEKLAIAEKVAKPERKISLEEELIHIDTLNIDSPCNLKQEINRELKMSQL